MPSIYSGPSSSSRKKGGSVYAGPRRKGRGETTSRLSPAQREWAQDYVRKNKDRNFFDRVGDDARSAALGLPGFFYGAGKSAVNDVRSQPLSLLAGPAAPLWAAASRRGKSELYKNVAKPMGESYAHTYGPALPFTKGGVGTTLGRMNEHPLFSALDATAGLSGGTTAAVRAGLLRPAARSRTIKGPGGQEINKAVVGSELGRRMRLGTAAALNRLPKDMRVLGEHSRYAGAVRLRHAKNYARMKLRAVPRAAALKKLDKPQFIATEMLAEFPTRAALDREIARLRTVDGGDATIAVFTDPKVLAAFENPTPKMIRYMDETDKLIGRHEALLPMGAEGLEQRAYQPMLVSRGARYVGDELVGPLAAWSDEFLRVTDRVKRAEKTPDRRMTPDEIALADKDWRAYSRSRGYTEAEIADFQRFMDLVDEGKALGLTLDDIAGVDHFRSPIDGPTIPQMIAEAKAEIAAAGGRPRYRPHVSVEDTTGTAVGTGGVGVQAETPYKQNKATLQVMGRLAYDIDALTPRYMRTIKWATYTDRHADLVAAGIPVDSLPVKRDKHGNPVKDRHGNPKVTHAYVKQSLGERIPYTTRTADEFEARIEKYIDADTESLTAGPTLENELTTTNPDLAMQTPDGKYLAVPVGFAEKIVGEYHRSTTAVRWFLEKPLDVWRAVVLNLRVGWLVNNIVGNSLLYLVKNAGPNGIRAWARNLLPEERGILASLAQQDKRLTDLDMAELFPEQTSIGTFMGSQVPTEGLAGAIAKYSPTRPLRSADVYTERRVRSAYAAELARKSPEVKARVKAMRGETRSWRVAARKELENNPELVERISQEINNGLGDYFSMNATERGAVRRIVPFYAWYKAITSIVVKMPVDYPARTLVMANMAKLGAEMESDSSHGMPWLEGAVSLPGGYVLGTQAMNPYSTDYAIGRGMFADDWFGARQREGLFNPYLSVFARAIGTEGNIGERLYSGGKEFVEQLPPSRLLFPPDRESYEGSNFYRELFSYLGVPIKKPAK